MDVDVWAKEFLLETVHTVVSTCISNEARLEFYNAQLYKGSKVILPLSGFKVVKRKQQKIRAPPKAGFSLLGVGGKEGWGGGGDGGEGGVPLAKNLLIPPTWKNPPHQIFTP